MAVPPYGTAIHQAIARGNLREMKSLAATTEKLLAASGDLPSAYQLLKIEIAKLQKKKSSR